MGLSAANPGDEAIDLRKLKDWRYGVCEVPEAFSELIYEYVIPHLKLVGHKLVEKQNLACCITLHLVMAGLEGRPVSDSRDTSKQGVRFRVDVWDAFVKAGFVSEPRKGSQISKKTTRYMATGRLLQITPSWDNSHFPPQGTTASSAESGNASVQTLVRGRVSKRDPATGNPRNPNERNMPLPWPGPEQHDLRQRLQLEVDLVAEINAVNRRHRWIACCHGSSFPVSVRIHQMHRGEWFRAPRFYTSGLFHAQGLSRKQRATIRIDDEPIVELDYSGMQLRMLYHQHGIDVQGDVYRADLIFPKFNATAPCTKESKTVRAFVKICTNTCLNVGSRRKAAGAIRYCLNKKCEHRRFLYREVLQPERCSVNQIVDRILSTHSDIAVSFLTNIGVELLGLEARIMGFLLKVCSLKAVPVVPMHDGLICRKSDETYCRNLMEAGYFIHLGFRPMIMPPNGGGGDSAASNGMTRDRQTIATG